jgi:hypothetical protein
MNARLIRIALGTFSRKSTFGKTSKGDPEEKYHDNGLRRPEYPWKNLSATLGPKRLLVKIVTGTPDRQDKRRLPGPAHSGRSRQYDPSLRV